MEIYSELDGYTRSDVDKKQSRIEQSPLISIENALLRTESFQCKIMWRLSKDGVSNGRGEDKVGRQSSGLARATATTTSTTASVKAQENLVCINSSRVIVRGEASPAAANEEDRQGATAKGNECCVVRQDEAQFFINLLCYKTRKCSQQSAGCRGVRGGTVLVSS